MPTQALAEASAPIRHALLIGINAYPGLAGKDLTGCVNDAQATAALLWDRFGFSPAHTQVLLEAQATRTGILAAFDALQARVGQGDVVVIFYAGHGSRVYLTDGDYAESIVPYDSGRGAAPNRDIMDYELNARVEQLNTLTPHVTLLFDCCHAGSATRDPFGDAYRSVEEIRSVAPPTPPPATRSAAPRAAAEGRDAVLIAACRAWEQAAELVDRGGVTPTPHGALTWHLLSALARAEGETSWRDVFEAIAAPLHARFPRQHPVLEGRAQGAVFGTSTLRATQALSVISVDGPRLVLAGGRLHGLTPETQFVLQPPMGSGGDDVPCEVIGMDALRTTVMAPAAAGAGLGWRAIVSARLLPSPVLTVALAGPQELPGRAALIAALTASPLLAVADATQADILVRGIAPDQREHPYPALGALKDGAWVAVTRDGRLAVRVRALNPNDAGDLVADLEGAARFRALLALDLPGADPELRAKVRLTVEHAGSARPGLPRLAEGDPIELVIENGASRPVHVSLLQFGLDGAVRIALPNPSMPDWRPGGYRLAAGQTLRLGKDYYGQGLTLNLPEGYPYRVDADSDEGDDQLTYMLLVTRGPADFDLLEQSSVRLASNHPIARVVDLAITGEGSRDIIPAKLKAADQGWATITASVRVDNTRDREISPGGSGRVLFYKVDIGGQIHGEVGITSITMSALPTETAFWSWTPTSWPAQFALREADEVPEAALGTRLKATRAMTNPTFSKTAKALVPPSGVERSWRIEHKGTVRGWMAKVGSSLVWYTHEQRAWLPRGDLLFIEAPLPKGKVVYEAIDVLV